MAASALGFGLMSFLARVSSQHAAHWAVTACTRSLVGAAVAAIASLARGGPILVSPTRMLWQRSVFGTASMMCTFYALSDGRAPLADAVTLTNTTPVFLAILAPLVLGEKGGLRVALAVPIAAAGVVLVLRPVFLFGGAARPDALVPEAIAVLGALFSSFAMLSLRRVSQGETPEAIVVHFSLTSAAVNGLVALFLAKAPSAGAWLPMIGAGLCAGFAQIAMTRAYSLARAARVGALGYLAVVVSAMLGVVVLGEPLSPHAAAGMALVIAGGAITSLTAPRKKAA